MTTLMSASLPASARAHVQPSGPSLRFTIAEIARVLRPGGRILLVFRGREHPLPKRLDPAVYEVVTTEQCMGWLASAGFDSQCHNPDGVPAEVSFVLARRSPRGLDSGISEQ
jgi:SAM-dependent methyltransferase